MESVHSQGVPSVVSTCQISTIPNGKTQTGRTFQVVESDFIRPVRRIYIYSLNSHVKFVSKSEQKWLRYVGKETPYTASERKTTTTIARQNCFCGRLEIIDGRRQCRTLSLLYDDEDEDEDDDDGWYMVNRRISCTRELFSQSWTQTASASSRGLLFDIAHRLNAAAQTYTPTH